MCILDICIILFIIMGGIVGFKEGFTKTLVNCIGYILIIILAFILKNPISEFLMLHLPFFNLCGPNEGLSVINIIFYESVAFALVFSILLAILKLLLFATSVFEKILSLTIVLGIPSKILGAIAGIIKNYVIVFALLFIFSIPGLNGTQFIEGSKLKNPMLEHTPILSMFTEKPMQLFNDLSDLQEEYKNKTSNAKFNYKAIELFLKYDIIKPDLVQKLVDQDKLNIKNADKLIEKYQEN